MKLKLVPGLALASGLALVTAACNNNAENPDEANPTATSTDAATPTGTSAANDHAAQFLTDVIQTNNAEIKFGQAAQDMGSTQAVKDFGKMLVDDHTKANEQAKQLAMALNVPVPEGTTPEADSELKMATGMSGADFDKDFATAMVNGHQKAIDKFQQEADSSDPATVTDFAKQTLPTLKKHLQTAQSLQK
jgi:putative membrane protein